MAILIPIILPICAALLTLVIRDKFELRSFREKYVGAVLILNMAFVIWAVFSGGRITIVNLTDNLSLFLKADEMSAVFTVLVSVMWLLAGFFSFEYMNHENRNESFYLFYLLSLGALIGLGFSGNFVTLYLFYEAMTLLTMPLVLHSRTREAISAALKYLFYSILGASLALIGLIYLSRYADISEFVPGGVLDLNKIGDNQGMLLVVAFLTILGFGVKAGMFPFHGWLPTAHPIAPAPASAVLSGVITKAGVLSIIRVVFYQFGVGFLKGTWVQTAWIILALITIFMGSMVAYREKLLKKRLAYSTVSQVSYVLLGLASFTPIGMIGALLHMVYHSIIKDGLFLSVGAVIYKTHLTFVDELKGIGKRMPIVMWCFTIFSVALIGIPPFTGFVSKWNLAMGCLQNEYMEANWIGPAVLLLSALLTAAYLLPIAIRAFIPGEDFDYSNLEKCEPSLLMTAPLIILACAALLLGIFPNQLIGLFEAIANMVM